MRLILKLTPTEEIIPFNHLPFLVGTIHRWIGAANEEHGNLSLYSFSWLQGGRKKEKGLSFENGSSCFLNFYEDRLLKDVLRSILQNPDMFCGLKVQDVVIQENPDFSRQNQFSVASPVHIKRFDIHTKKCTHYLYTDEEASLLLTETLKRKMQKVGLIDDSLLIEFDKTYPNPKVKLVNYKGVGSKTSICPIIIYGTPESKAFAWNVGIGNCTGIGLGAIY